MGYVIVQGLIIDYCSCYCFGVSHFLSRQVVVICWNRGLVMIQELKFWVWLLAYSKQRQAMTSTKSEDDNTAFPDFLFDKENVLLQAGLSCC